jgi:hypothetical protein
MKREKTPTLPKAEHSLRRHFGKLALQNLITASRTFPLAARVDVQVALEKLFSERTQRLLGVHTQFIMKP